MEGKRIKKKNMKRRICHILKRSMSVIIVAVMFITVLPAGCVIPTENVEAASYDVNKAVAYARKYALNYNPAYYAYTIRNGYGDDVDCANFVSQCIEAGGFPRSASWQPGSYAWVNCNGMVAYFESLGYKVIYNPSASQINPGNPVFTASYHVMICTGKNQYGTPYLCGHTNDRLDLLVSGPYYCTILLNDKDIIVSNSSQDTPDGHAVPTRMLSRGYSGDDVKWVQSVCNKTIGTNLDVDGIFGNNTYSAVRSFQSRYGLEVDGIVGPLTIAKMKEAWNATKVVNPTSVSLSSAAMDITTGNEKQLSVNVSPSNTTNKNVTWKSNDTSVATVDGSGKIKGLKAGQAVVTASTHNGKKAECKITVRNPIVITFTNDDGTVLETQTINYGESARMPVTPEKQGYVFAGWSGTYQNVKENATVKATYTKNTYKVTFKNTNGTRIGSIQIISYGDSAIAPDVSSLDIPTGYTFSGWSEDFSKVRGELTVYPVYKWTDVDESQKQPTTPAVTSQNNKNENKVSSSAASSNSENKKAKKELKVGDTTTISKALYKVTGNDTVSYMKTTSKAKSIIIPNTVNIGGKTYKVTSINKKAFIKNKIVKKITIGKNVTEIGANAFYKCRNLKTLVIKSKKLKKVGKKSIYGIYKKAVIKVPGSKTSSYKKLFTESSGYKKSMMIKRQ